MNFDQHFARNLSAFLLVSSLAACGGGGGSNTDAGNNTSGPGNSTADDSSDSADNSNPQRVAFPQYDSATSQNKMYSGQIIGAEVKMLSPLSNTSGNVKNYFKVSPDGAWVAYIADAESDGEEELYISKLDGSVLGHKMSPALPARSGRMIDNLVWSPDSTQLAFVMNLREGTSAGDSTYDNTWELYVSSINGAVGVRVSGDLQAGREANTDVIKRQDTSGTESLRSDDVVQWAPDGSRLAFIGDYESNQVFDLYTTTPAGNSNVLKVSGSMADVTGDDGLKWSGAGSRRETFAWAPNSSAIAFRAQKETYNVFELYLANPNSGGEPVKQSEPSTTPYEGADFFAWAPDSSRIAYSTYDASLKDYQLWTVVPGSSPSRDKITPIPSNPNQVGVPYFAWAPDSSRLAYASDQEINESYSLYVAYPDTDTGIVRVSGSTTYDGLEGQVGVASFYWSPDSSMLGYRAYQEKDNVRELYVSARDGSRNVKKSGNLSSSSSITQYQWSPNSQYLAYIANQDNSSIYEIYASEVAGAATKNVKLNPALVTGGNVETDYLLWSADSSRVLYIADQNVDEQIELFSSTPTGSANNVRVSQEIVAPELSFANDIFTQMGGCNSCHTHSWYVAGDASATWSAMTAAGRFNFNNSNYFIVEKLDGTLSHSGGTYASLAADFNTWIDAGASDN